MTATSLMLILSQTAPTIPEGWGGFGLGAAALLTSVLGWLLWIHLPAKDAQLKELIVNKDAAIRAFVEAKDVVVKSLVDGFSSEREKDRMARHEAGNIFQSEISASRMEYVASMREIEKQHLVDAEKDREAFTKRNEKLEDTLRVALDKQTAELRIAMQAVCRMDRRAYVSEAEAKRLEEVKEPEGVRASK